jgi:hypothetical protein
MHEGDRRWQWRKVGVDCFRPSEGVSRGVKKPLLAALVLSAAALIASAAAPVVTEEISLGFLPMDWVASALQKTLSPQTRTALVTPTGPIRITDHGENIAAARQALEQMQKAPAVVPVEISFSTTARRVVQRLPVEPPVVSSGIPVPDRYDPPRIIANPGGGITVVPSQPRDFRTRNVGPGTVVIPSPTGYQTLTPEVRMTETETVTAGGPARRFSASTVPGKPVLFTVVRQAPDAAALRALALKYGAIVEAEPAWAAAGTELLVRPEISGGSLVVNITPQIVLPPSAAGQAGRRIPISACAAGVLIARGAPGNTGILPKTDPEFYRLFLGAPQAAEDTFTSMTVTAQVQYVGGPPE